MRFRLGLTAVIAAVPLVAAGQANAISGYTETISPAHPGPYGSAPRHRVIPLRSTNPSALRAAKQAALRRYEARQRRRGASRAPSGFSVFGGLNGSGLTASQSQFAVPPDTTGSIGPSQYVEIVNDAVAVFSRSGLGRIAGPRDNEHFMASPGVSTPSPNDDTLVTDPQMQWDQQSGHWFYLASAFPADGSAGPNFLLFGFSKTSSPTDLFNGWCRYTISSSTSGSETDYFDDYPKLGHDNDRVVFGSNVFDGSLNYVTSRIRSLPKPPAGTITNCASYSPSVTVFGSAASPLKTSDGNLAGTPVPANTANSSGAAYVVAADDPLETGTPRSQIMVWHVSGTSLIGNGNVGVSSYDVPRSAFQPGAPIDTLDARLTMAVAEGDPGAGAEAVWTQHTIDPGDGSVVMRWYELIPSTRARRQQGTISDPSADIFNGAISPGTSGTFAGLNFNRSSPSLAPEIRARVRGVGLPLGATTDDVLLGSSSAAASDDSCTPLGLGPPCRWGDYAGASPDPSNPNVVWGANQAQGNPQPASSCPSAGFISCPAWFTRIFALTASSAVLGTSSATRDTTPPRLRVAVRRRQRLRRVLRHRLRFRVRASERARIFSRVVIGRRTAIRLHLLSRRSHRRRVTVARRRSFLVRAHRTTRVRIKFSRRARRRMRRAHRRFAVQLRVRARDGAGNYSRLVKRRVVLIP